jgi:hypothetical protein
MELKLKAGIEETYIYVPFINGNIIAKFIDKGLYSHLYELYPDLFDVVEPVKETKKTKVVNDIFIDNGTEEGNITE